ncbi:MAG TPA: 2-phospho-L-lactate guanylyltransferase, partial [Caulobacteraceae bacterium]
DMLLAVGLCTQVSRTWVVTPTQELAELAKRHGATVIIQEGPATLNGAFAQAIAEVSDSAPYDPVALMPGDLPLLQPGDLAAAILLARTHAMVLAPALDGGTGLLGLRAGVNFQPAFGADSFRRHSAMALEQGLTVGLVVASSLSRDVDRPEDLSSVLEMGASTVTSAFLRDRLQSQFRS